MIVPAIDGFHRWNHIYTNTHAHTHTHMHTCTCTHTHTLMHTLTHSYKHNTHTHVRTCMHTHTQTHIHTHIHTCIHTNIRSYWHTHTCIHIYMHTSNYMWLGQWKPTNLAQTTPHHKIIKYLCIYIEYLLSVTFKRFPIKLFSNGVSLFWWCDWIKNYDTINLKIWSNFVCQLGWLLLAQSHICTSTN